MITLLDKDFQMHDILGRKIVGYDEACYLKEVGFNGECTGYYHSDYPDDKNCEYWMDDERYECVGFRPLYRNSYSIYRVAAPTVRVAEIFYRLYHIKPYSQIKNDYTKN